MNAAAPRLTSLMTTAQSTKRFDQWNQDALRNAMIALDGCKPRLPTTNDLQAKPAPVMSEIQRVLADGPATEREIAKRGSINANSISCAMGRLIGRGVVKKIELGNGRVAFELIEAEEKPELVSVRIMKALKAGKPMSNRQIANRTGLKHNTVTSATADMHHGNRISRYREGRVFFYYVEGGDD